MISKETGKAIEIIKRMDLKVAIPHKYVPPSFNDACATTTKVAAQYIHVPSIINALETEIREAYRKVEDVKRATALLLDIKREYIAKDTTHDK